VVINNPYIIGIAIFPIKNDPPVLVELLKDYQLPIFGKVGMPFQKVNYCF